ncbi:AraC family transcriptional regulator (plasmid) [Azospirillum oryzae]|uniref:AraC family transcriptional regulator n=1 Tax=Azospirillum oryzae TaxID=286727 RepID=A0A6N1AFY5_9PROT|nr:AraC family transcriptional regulator [Azospirillum oryzae]KAA0588813.1 AraC family transcriptional regulator [Azospirillum oryzae]QKS50159.1 AraC family transcriptional regulator [Azospirillum oryzae]GLR80275.1 transcriptional regulator [Azospirillum oryzae]
MSDPLAQVVGLLQPRASFSKIVQAAGPWRVRRSEAGRPFYCVVLGGSCRLTVRGGAPITLENDDFVLIPAAYDFSMSSMEPMAADADDTVPVELAPGEFLLGHRDRQPEVRNLIGYCAFGSTDAALLVSLLPQLVHIRGEKRLTALVQLVNEESRTHRPARDVVLARLLEVLLIEALRSTTGAGGSPGLLRGLGDERIAVALRRIHERPTWPWTVAQLAKEAALSRSAFFDRFRRTVGMTPMDYLLDWRMALAKDLLRRREGGIVDIAERVGYGSASAFSVAFARHVGVSPTAYARGLSSA